MSFKFEIKGITSDRPTGIKSIFICRRHRNMSTLEIKKVIDLVDGGE